MMQSKTPPAFRASLPLEPEARRAAYLLKYTARWRGLNPDYMTRYQRRYRELYGSEKKNRLK